ncbi:MAG TPA: antitoxin Xre-like helix-turn-helix domain-containing protein [Vicinamibacteria bacterium]|jgi:transcriptional regulator with XRE-family HTH domain
MKATAPAATASAGAVLTRAVRRAAELLDLSQRDLAAILGVSPSTVSRFAQRPLVPESKEGELAVLFVRFYRSLDALLGGDAEASRLWLRAGNRHLGGVPAELIRSVSGLLHAIEYLDAMRGKV